MKRLISLALFLTLASPLAAQTPDVVGTTVVGGKRVELLDDQTWRFAEITDGGRDCTAINQVLQICGLSEAWNALDTTGTEFIRQYRLNSRTYAGIIHEELGSEDGLTLEFMRSAVLENAAMFTGVRAEDIPVLGVETLSVDENPAERVTYSAKFNGLDIVYQNTIVNAPHHNIQVVVWSIGKTLTDDARAANDSFVDALRIDFPGN